MDADYEGDLDNHWSCSEHVFTQALGPTVWGTQYQPIITLSTMEVEHIALTRAMKQILWIYSAMDKVGYPQPQPVILWNDNTGVVLLMQNMKHNAQVKHINIHYHYIQEHVEDGEIDVLSSIH